MGTILNVSVMSALDSHAPGQFDHFNDVINCGVMQGKRHGRNEAIDAGNGPEAQRRQVEYQALVTVIFPSCDADGASTKSRKRRRVERPEQIPFSTSDANSNDTVSGSETAD